MKQLSPQQIEAESMQIIEKEAGTHLFSNDEWSIVKRIIHATADFDVMKTIWFQGDAIASGIQSIKQARPVYADTGMLVSAMNKKITEKWRCPLLCYVSDEDVCIQSQANGITRSCIALRKAAPFLNGGIVVIGNAPTALNEVVNFYKIGKISPSLVIGMPVGFVGAAESKENLISSGLRCITIRGRKGGTPSAAATINALIHLTERE